MKFLRFLLPTVFFLGLFIVAPSLALATDSPPIYINEVMWRGSESSTSDEWFELFNNSDEEIDLSGWSVFDEVKDPNIPMLTIASGSVAPRGYFLVSNNSKDHIFSKGESTLNVDPDYVNSDVALSNSEFKIALKRPGQDQPIDVAGDGQKPFLGEYDGKISSMQRVSYDLPGDEKDSWRPSMEAKNLDAGSLSFATPRTWGKTLVSLGLENNKVRLGREASLKFEWDLYDPKNEVTSMYAKLIENGVVTFESPLNDKSFDLPSLDHCPRVEIDFDDSGGTLIKDVFDLVCYQLSSEVKIYEVLSHPSSVDWNKDGLLNTKDEWIEVVNFSNEEIRLDGWKIKDQSGKVFEIKNKNIFPQDFTVFLGSETGLSLNDSGEKIFLFDPLGNLVDSLNIPSSSSKADMSYSLWGDNWQWTSSPTPGAVNIIAQKGIENFDILENDLAGKTVRLSGEVYEVGRDSICMMVQGKPITIMLTAPQNFLKNGQKVSLQGRVSTSSSAIITASPSDFIIKEDPGPIPAATSPLIANNEESTLYITRTTKKKGVLLSLGSKLSPLVLSGRYDDIRGSINYQKLLLYFAGILSFLTIILIYDFCYRE